MLSRRKLRFLIAFGPTREPLDPVRFLSNYSTGEMGRALVAAAKKRGHAVTALECPADAETARELGEKLKRLIARHEVLVMAAAVCDVRPAKVAPAKIKKETLLGVRFVKNPDILADLAKTKKKNQIFVGFALESGRLLANGLKKLRSKSLELLVLQKVTKKERPFGEKKVHFIVLNQAGRRRDLGLLSKARLADFLVRQTEKTGQIDSENRFC
ncbi:MAG: phosphopantothenoylcysteine decarboxylase [Candidatus Omnitrophica bacterium]|nr:phosphopantothenoylcysteine decarboxylase [Candidatus Omnitrophota bacterium]